VEPKPRFTWQRRGWMLVWQLARGVGSWGGSANMSGMPVLAHGPARTDIQQGNLARVIWNIGRAV
jgi:hypothetical protein